MTRIILAIVAGMLALPAHAQSAPPPVPRYNCGLTPQQQQQVLAVMQQAYATGNIAVLAMLNGFLEGNGKGCEMRYNRAMQQWQAEMQRWQLMNR